MKMELNKYSQWLGHKGPVYTLALIDEHSFVSAGSDGLIIKWTPDNPVQGLVIAQTGEQIFCSHYISSASLLVLGTMSGYLLAIDLKQQILLHKIDLSCGSVFSIQSDDQFLYVATQSGVLIVFNHLLESVNQLAISNLSLRCIAINHTDHQIYVASSDKHVYIINPIHLSVRSQIQVAQHSIFSLAYSAESKRLYIGSRDARLYVYQMLEKPELIKTIDAHLFTINDMLIDPSKQILISASRDKTIRIWDLQSFELLKVIDQKYEAHRNSVNKLLYLGQSNLLISASDDRSVMGWKLHSINTKYDTNG